MTKIFVTGVTGFIGGDALYAISKAHPEYDITCLVRSSDKGAAVAKDYPKFKFAYGDLNDTDLVENESKKADVVINFAADNEEATRAIIRGLSARESSPGFFINTSGTGILLIDDGMRNVFGESSDIVYDDLEGVGKVTSLPDAAPHRIIDKIVLAAEEETAGRVKSTTVCPPCVYGQGRGSDNTRSGQVPELARNTLEKGHGIKVNAGKTLWSNVHVYDLSTVYLKLVENAAAGGSLAEWPNKPAIWGKEGYFFSENGEHVWGDISQLIATEAKGQGLIDTDEVKSVSAEEAQKLTPYGHALWGANSRSRAKRARKVLGWKPSAEALENTIEAAVEFEARSLGSKPGHAKVAAGDA